jgi:hypothetical protein
VQEPTIQIGTLLAGRYRIAAEKGPRDLGSLYTGYDVQDNRPVEVLFVAPRLGSGAALLSRLHQANRAVADLRQPALPALEQIDLFGGQLYLVRRPAAGRSLAEMLADSGALEIEAAVEITIGLCEALAPLHRAGLVHGGLHPGCVWVQEGVEPVVTLLDAGLLPALRPQSSSLRPQPAPAGRPWGRMPHLSPEQAAGEAAIPASDVYVAGSLLYEMLTGRPPFRTADAQVLALQHLRQEPPSLQILAPQISSPLVQIVQKALSKEPAARYRNAAQLAHILRSQVAVRFAPRVVPATVAPAAAPPPAAQKRLVVPPPPTAGPGFIPAARPIRAPGRMASPAGAAEQESGGSDWLLVALIVLASIAVLGLIPLWRTVYRHYAVPPQLPTPIPSPLPLGYAVPEPAKDGAALDDFRLVWYNSIDPQSAAWPVGVERWQPVSRQARSRFPTRTIDKLAACGV